jgi:hypothetical protein
MKLVYLMLATATLLPTALQAKWKPQYASSSPEIRDWYKSRKLTDAAAKRFAFKSCCDGHLPAHISCVRKVRHSCPLVQ